MWNLRRVLLPHHLCSKVNILILILVLVLLCVGCLSRLLTQ